MSRQRGKKVVVAMSGGVDSSVAACLLHEQGYDVTGLFMCAGIDAPHPDPENRPEGDPTRTERRRGCCNADDADDARRAAATIGIAFFALDFREAFDHLIRQFADEYARGRTPNPCILCNARLKFGRLAEYGRTIGADFIATGHYARIEQRQGQPRLCRGTDADKDQSYVLFGIERDVLGRIRLPVGGMTKDHVRAEAERLGLRVSAKAESQDICFAPDGDYARVVRERRPDAFVEGAILDAAGQVLGRHNGIAHYTIGQRRGLGVAAGSPVYVTRIDAAANTVTLGPREQLASRTLTASHVNWLVDPPTTPRPARVQIRYGHRAAPATIEPRDEKRVHVRFDENQYAITLGQAAVFYDENVVLGGGWIDSAELV